jgi:hypothetical protein
VASSFVAFFVAYESVYVTSELRHKERKDMQYIYDVTGGVADRSRFVSRGAGDLYKNKSMRINKLTATTKQPTRTAIDHVVANVNENANVDDDDDDDDDDDLTTTTTSSLN